MDNKKLILKDTEGKEYIFISEQCDNSNFTYNETESNGEGLFKMNYNYVGKNDEFYNFYKEIKTKDIVEVSLYIYDEEFDTYIEIFSSVSKELPVVRKILYNENYGQVLKFLTAGLIISLKEA